VLSGYEQTAIFIEVGVSWSSPPPLAWRPTVSGSRSPP